MKKYVVVLLNLGYWLVFMLLILVIFGLISSVSPTSDESDKPVLRNWLGFMTSTTILPGVICFYLNYFFVFNRYLQKRKIPQFFIAVIATALICGVVGAFSGAAPWLIGDEYYIANMSVGNLIAIIVFFGFVAMLNGVIGLVMRGFISWYGDIRIKESLAAKNTEMELSLVKSQINPHFLFNTINNIDVLISKDPEKASEYLNRLSDIMRFMLYESKPDRILLSREIAYITKYIDLHRIRSNNTDYVHFEVIGDPSEYMVPPMLFIPFIENAFKHVGDKKKTPAINIKLIIENNSLLFNCCNHYFPDKIQDADTLNGGLGDKLIRRRLELLFPNAHTLQLTTDNEQYCVSLKIIL